MSDQVRRAVRCGVLAAFLALGGCAPRETLFQSNFDATPVGQAPSSAQQVGTASIHGPGGSVVVVAPARLFV